MTELVQLNNLMHQGQPVPALVRAAQLMDNLESVILSPHLDSDEILQGINPLYYFHQAQYFPPAPEKPDPA